MQVSDQKDFYFFYYESYSHCTRNRNRDFVNNFYESNISIWYNSKRLLITKSTSFSELQNHQTPMVKLGLANLYNNFGRILSDSRQLATSHHTQ